MRVQTQQVYGGLDMWHFSKLPGDAGRCQPMGARHCALVVVPRDSSEVRGADAELEAAASLGLWVEDVLMRCREGQEVSDLRDFSRSPPVGRQPLGAEGSRSACEDHHPPSATSVSAVHAESGGREPFTTSGPGATVP